MIKNIIRVALRSLRKRKVYAILNILGLASSIAFSFLLWFYVTEQRSYDQQFSKADRIYRVNADFNMNGKRDIYSNAPRPLAPTLKSEYPEVVESARIYGFRGLNTHTGFLEVERKRVKTEKIFISDSTIFGIFDRVFVEGDPVSALKEPNSIVITESLAQKLFGNSDAYGKTVDLVTSKLKSMKVTGVIKDDLNGTHLPAEAYISWTTFPYEWELTQWYGAHVYSYILLNETNDIGALESKIPEFFEKYMKGTFEELNGTANLIFQPVIEIHLSSEYVWEPYAHGSKANVMALMFVILILIAYACINYVNLATARATERAGEVGIRKAMGSSRKFLIYQFMAESVLLALFSGFIALGICEVLRPYFNMLSDMRLSLADLTSWNNLLLLFTFSLLMGLVAGFYPAFYLSSLPSLVMLKGRTVSGASGEMLRKMLITSQYVVASILIASVLFVSQQTRYIKNKDIGYDKENVIAVRIPSDSVVSNHIKPYINSLMQNPQVIGVTNTFYEMDQEANQFTPTLENEDGSTFAMGVDVINVDPDFMDVMGIEVVTGRNFLKGSEAEEEQTILINETAVKKFGWEQNPLGGKFVSVREDEDGNVKKYRVAGVVKDFYMGVSYQRINPLIILLNNRGGRTLYIRVAGSDTRNSLDFSKTQWLEMFSGFDFDYYFLDEALADLYKKEEKFLDLLAAFSFIVLFIASIGIFGLISFTTALKRKEIAIRKVLGSPAKAIIYMLSKRFLVLLIIANVIALPATYYLINMWLENFAYRIQLGVEPFMVSFVVCVLFTAISLIYHTMRAVRSNPVNALSYE